MTITCRMSEDKTFVVIDYDNFNEFFDVFKRISDIICREPTFADGPWHHGVAVMGLTDKEKLMLVMEL